jgi:predicted nucleotidyltransferase
VNALRDADRVEIVKWAERHPNIARVHLYGSRARGDHHAGSDIDLAIEMDAPDADQAYRMWSALKSEFDEAPELHLSAQVQLEWFAENANLGKVGTGVQTDGILLFEREA